jgi:hypothetical protein
MFTRRQVLLRKLGHRRGGARLEGCDPREESACEQAECPGTRVLVRMLRCCDILSALYNSLLFPVREVSAG